MKPNKLIVLKCPNRDCPASKGGMEIKAGSKFINKNGEMVPVKYCPVCGTGLVRHRIITGQMVKTA